MKIFEDISTTEPLDAQEAVSELLCKAIKRDKDGTITADVGGVISDDSKDTEGESINQDIIDFNYIKKGFGRIKYEHGDVNGTDEPERFIGVIDRIIRKGHESEFEGRIIARPNSTTYKLAKAVIDDLENIEHLNNTNRGTPKRAGWSIEGGTVKNKKTGKILKAFVNNVVYTTRPVNPNSVAKLIKSMSAGYGYNIGDKTGGRSLVKESIKKSPIQFINNGETVMKYATKDHAYKSCLAKGMKEEEAKAEAEKLFAAQEEGEKKEGLEANAAHEGAASLFKKSLDSVQKFLKNFKGEEIFEEEKEAMAKSLKPTGAKEDEIDIGGFLKSTGDITAKTGENLVMLAKSQEAMLQAFAQTNDLIAMTLKKSQDIEKELSNVSYENMVLRKAVARHDRGVTAADGKETIIDSDNDSITQLTTPMAKSAIRHLMSQATNPQHRDRLHRELVDLEAGVLGKSRGAELLKLYQDGTLKVQA